MKKTTILAALLLSVSFMSAQTTFDITWAQGVGADATITIETGDTVIWTWGNLNGHNLVPIPGEMDAPVDFGVEDIIAQNGFVYEYTFTEVAEIDYRCDPHQTTMLGKITIIEALSTEDKFALNLSYFPNPVTERMTLTSLYALDSYEVYSVLGQKVMTGSANGNITEIDMSALNNGLYLVTAVSGELTNTFKVVKK